MNIHTQQSNCEAEIAAGAWGPDALQRLIGTIHLDEEMAPSAKLPNCCQNWTGQATPKRQGGPDRDRLDILGDETKINYHKIENLQVIRLLYLGLAIPPPPLVIST